MTERISCAVVNDGCKSPAGYRIGLHGSGEAPEGTPSCRAECFSCGQPVCTDPGCSQRIAWGKHGRRRVCQHCQDDEIVVKFVEVRWVRGVQTFTALVGGDVLSVFREGATWTARIAGQRHEGFESSSAAKGFALRLHKANIEARSCAGS